MKCLRRLVLPFAAVSALAAAVPGHAAPPAEAAAKPSPAAAKAAPPSGAQKLSREEMAGATRLDALAVPTPGELFAALDKVAKPNWQTQYRPPIPTAFTSRPQIALNLGGLIADGYIAVEAEDAQQVKNIGKDITALAKTLGVSENVLRRGKSIEDFADTNEWSTLKEELEATQNEVKLAMEEQHDEELVTLVSLGGWIRGTEAVSGWVAANYAPAGAKLLRQPAVVAFLREKIAALPEKVRGDGLVKSVDEKLAALGAQVSFPRGETPTAEAVNALKTTASQLAGIISRR